MRPNNEHLKIVRNILLYILLIAGCWYFYGPRSPFDKGIIQCSIEFVYSQF